MARPISSRKSAALSVSTTCRLPPWRGLSAVAKPVLNPLQKRMVAARRTLAARGLNEAVTWSFLPEEQAKLFGGGQR